MAREFLRLTSESTPGTFNGAGTQTIIDLTDSNAYDVRPTTIRQGLRTVGVYNRPRKLIGTYMDLTGGLSTLLYPSQAPNLVGWFTGLSSPLPTMTIDHCIQMENTGATKIYSRHLGMTVREANLSCGESGPALMLKLTLQGMGVASITSSDFAEPAVGDYPADVSPYIFPQLNGAFTIGTSRSEAADLNVSIKNHLDVHRFMGTYPSVVKYTGRDVDWTSTLAYLSTTDRANYEATTSVAGSFVFTSGGNTLTMNMATSFFDSVKDNLDMDKLYIQQLMMKCYVDGGGDSDFTIAAT